MKITDILCHKLYARRQPAFGKSVVTGLGPAAMSRYAMVEIKTNQGIIGYGEVANVFDPDGHGLADIIDKKLTPLLVDKNPFEIASLNHKLDCVIGPNQRPAKAGIDIALYDLIGKALDIPIYQLLGGPTRRRIPLSYSIPFGSPDEMAELALAKHNLGFKTIKIKIGQGSDVDIMAIKRIREALGNDITIRIDANMTFTNIAHACEIIRAVEKYRIELIEQPLTPDRLNEIAEIKSRVNTPIMVDESVQGPNSMLDIVNTSAADITNIYVMESGGITDATTNFRIAAAAGLRAMIGSMPEMGIGTAAQIHLGGAVPNLDLASDCCGSLYHLDDVVSTPFEFDEGYAIVNDAPGLGVDVLEKQVQKLSTPPNGILNP